MIRKLATNTWIHIAIGALLMGSWAFFANRAHPFADAFQAAALQGLLSGFLTAVLKTIADRLRSIVQHWFLAAGLSYLFSIILLLGAHTIGGTPELLATVAVPLAVSGLYIFTYCYLRRGAADG